MPRERLLPPSGSGRSHQLCVADDCPLLGSWAATPGGDRVCFIHDGLEPRAWPSATDLIHRHDALFRLKESMSNALPGEPIPDATLQALRDRGYGEVADLAGGKVRTSRDFSAALRGYLIRFIRPPAAPEERLAASTFLRTGMRTVGDLLE